MADDPSRNLDALDEDLELSADDAAEVTGGADGSAVGTRAPRPTTTTGAGAAPAGGSPLGASAGDRINAAIAASRAPGAPTTTPRDVPKTRG